MYPWYNDPSWLEAIGTVSAVIITLSILIGSKILNYLSSPNIKASRPVMAYHKPPQLDGSKRGRISITWEIQNHPRLFLFGGIAINVITKYWFDKKEIKDYQEWTHVGNTGTPPILPKNKKWTQFTIFDGELEDTEYILHLVFYQTGFKDKDREDVIAHSKLTIPWPPHRADGKPTIRKNK